VLQAEEDPANWSGQRKYTFNLFSNIVSLHFVLQSILTPSINEFNVVSGNVKLSGYVNNDIHYQDKYIHEHLFMTIVLH